MEIKDLTEEMNKLFRAQGWYAPDSPKKQLPRNLSISLSLESAEVLELFQWSDSVTDVAALRGELADVALYLFQLAYVSGIDLEQAILDKIKFNYSRVWPEDHLNKEPGT